MQRQQPLAVQQAPRGLNADANPYKKEPQSRAARRAHVIRDLSRKPFARFRSGTRTQQPEHFKMWMADLQIKSALQRMKVMMLADRATDPRVGSAYGLVAADPRYRNVWDLAHATRADLLALRGIGPASLTAMQADLNSHKVAVRWIES